jgi:hypothetical protein
MEDMRRIVIDAAEVVTVVSRGKKRRRGRDDSAPDGLSDGGPKQPPATDVAAAGDRQANVSDREPDAGERSVDPDNEDDVGGR